MHRTLATLLIACLAQALPADDAVAPAAAVASLDKILACNAEALGGAGLAAIDKLRIELDIREPTFAVRGSYVASRDGRMRIDIFADGQRVFAEGLEDGQAWQWSPQDGVRAAGPAGGAVLRNGVEAPGRFWTLAQLRARGLGVELLPDGPLARAGEWHLRLTRADGSALDYFIDRESCLPTREVSRRAFHPDADATEVLIGTAFSEPFTVDGVVRFRRSEQHNLDSGEWLGTTVLRQVEHNPDLAEDYFEAR